MLTLIPELALASYPGTVATTGPSTSEIRPSDGAVVLLALLLGVILIGVMLRAAARALAPVMEVVRTVASATILALLVLGTLALVVMMAVGV